MSKAPRSGEPGVQSITSVPESLDADQSRRTKQYLIQMGIRLVCFLSAVFALTTGHMWLGWALAAGAVILPYTAVIFVNAPNRRAGHAEAYTGREPAALPGSPGTPGDGPGRRPPSSSGTHTVIDGDGLLDDVRDEPVEKKN